MTPKTLNSCQLLGITKPVQSSQERGVVVHLAMSGEVSSLPLSGYLDLNLCFGWGDDSGHLNYQDFLSKMILGLDDEIVVDWNPGNRDCPISSHAPHKARKANLQAQDEKLKT
ncbi:hypothetical protein D9757_012677 [Collybiopsis confluens]|uniref:Uncharacterized protein n=1 Tax=Collybiopsis confluens TaxID=2823264 RepID=A0A8H5LIX1_9AGAR|nr:hypothetical protein D9757_012677 [Collybiopsis confluens]